MKNILLQQYPSIPQSPACSTLAATSPALRGKGLQDSIYLAGDFL